jgi:hypothetical protein
MYKFSDLKEKIVITDKFVECPIKNCNEIVDRKYRADNNGKNFICPIHEIQITPTTFINRCFSDNLLWFDNFDKTLLEDIFTVKRECRMANDNSEDAVTWNVIRYLEKVDLVALLLNNISNDHHKIVDLIYWSYSTKEKGLWTILSKARTEFGESDDKGSEPDIIIQTDSTLFFIEAKLFSSNKTSGLNETLKKRLQDSKKYILGDAKLFDKVFSSSYESIVCDQKYELMRFWLLGNWIAKKLNLKFHLVNLVLKDNEFLIESEFGKHINTNEKNRFSRYTWESIFLLISGLDNNDENSKVFLDYFNNKAAGYNNKGLLKKAFNVFDIKVNNVH